MVEIRFAGVRTRSIGWKSRINCIKRSQAVVVARVCFLTEACDPPPKTIVFVFADLPSLSLKRHNSMIRHTNSSQIEHVNAYLRVSNAAAAIRFYIEAFGAEERYRLTEPSDRVAHAELLLGSVCLMVSDEYPENGLMSPTTFEGTTVGLYLAVTDVDSMYQRTIEAGAMSLEGPKNKFYGERTARIRDPFGHEWILAQQTENLSPTEMQERFDAMFR